MKFVIDVVMFRLLCLLLICLIWSICFWYLSFFRKRFVSGIERRMFVLWMRM